MDFYVTDEDSNPVFHLNRKFFDIKDASKLVSDMSKKIEELSGVDACADEIEESHHEFVV
jgi:hypothetical protein